MQSVVRFIEEQPLSTLYVSTVTLAEIRFGIEKVESIQKRTALENWITHQVRPMFASRVLEVTEDIMLTWRVMVDLGRRKYNHTFSQPDLIIAATAQVHDLTVVTRNVRDFEKSGVSIFNPWS